MKFLSNSVIVGIFSTGAAFCAGFLFLLENCQKFPVLVKKTKSLFLVFDENVTPDLNEGGKVTLNGIRVGRVKHFFLGENHEQRPCAV